MTSSSATEAAPARFGFRSTMLGARVREAGWGYGFAVVPIAVFGLFFVYPFIYAVYISFFHWGILGKQAGGHGTFNYSKVLHDPIFHTALRNIAEYTFAVVPLELALGLSLALLDQPEDPRPQLLPLVFLLPLDRLVRGDHDDRALHLQRPGPLQPDHRQQQVLVR